MNIKLCFSEKKSKFDDYFHPILESSYIFSELKCTPINA